MRNSHLGFALSFCVASMTFVASGLVCQAALVEYTIDPVRSSLTVSGSYSGFALVEQTADSLVTKVSGTISGDLVGGTLTFSGGNSILAAENPNGPFIPALDTLGVVDNYGVRVPLGTQTLADGVIRDAQLDFAAGTVTDSVVPATLEISLPYYVFAYEIYLLSPDKDETIESDDPVLNTTGSAAGLTREGLVETLTIPILRQSGDAELQLTLEGQIVATRAIPEPTTGILFSLGLIGLVALHRRARRRGR